MIAHLRKRQRGAKMEEIFRAVRLVLAEYKKQNGEDAKLKEGDWFVAELNNATVFLQVKDAGLDIRFTGDKPVKVDYSFGFYQEGECIERN